MKNGTSEIVVVVREDGNPAVMVINEDGEVQYYKLTKLSFREHAELWGADKVNKD